MNRRTFISSLAVAGTAVAATPSLVFAGDVKSKPRVGLVGCGWYGGVALESFANHADVEFVSLCDPNAHALTATLQALSKFQSGVPKTFSDFREMLASGHHDIVIVSTPDHWHTLPALAAMKAGADVFIEKPISVDVIEGEALVAAARKYVRVTQVNTQRRSTRCLAEARDKYLRSGKIGTVGLVETYSYLHGRQTDVYEETAVPPHLDYELWAGPAPKRPFTANLESKTWRNFMEYGNGQIGDLGVHMFDCVRWMMGLGWPKSISSTGGIYVDKKASANISDTQRSVFRYADLDVSWEHRTWGAAPIPQRDWTDLWGIRFIGNKGILNANLLGYEFIPADGSAREGFHLASKTGNLENIDFSLAGSAVANLQKTHVLDFMNARANRSRAVADIEEGHISTACCVLANLAQELGRALHYDPATRTIPGDAEATRRLSREYRSPWTHPDPTAV